MTVIGIETVILNIVVFISILVHITLLWYYVSVSKERRIKRSAVGFVFAIFSTVLVIYLIIVTFSGITYPFGLVLYFGTIIWSILLIIDLQRRRKQMKK